MTPKFRRGEIVVRLWPFAGGNKWGLKKGTPYIVGTVVESTQYDGRQAVYKVWNICTADYYPHWMQENELRRAREGDIDIIENQVVLFKITLEDGEPRTTEEEFRPDLSAWLPLIRAVIREGGMFPEKAMPR